MLKIESRLWLASQTGTLEILLVQPADGLCVCFFYRMTSYADYSLKDSQTDMGFFFVKMNAQLRDRKKPMSVCRVCSLGLFWLLKRTHTQSISRLHSVHYPNRHNNLLGMCFFTRSGFSLCVFFVSLLFKLLTIRKKLLSVCHLSYVAFVSMSPFFFHSHFQFGVSAQFVCVYTNLWTGTNERTTRLN